MYLAAILFSLFGLLVLDYRFKLVLFERSRNLLITLTGVLFFSLWDYFGIQNGIFFKGDSNLLIGVELFHEYPIEEFFFLTLLMLCGQLALAGFSRLRIGGCK